MCIPIFDTLPLGARPGGDAEADAEALVAASSLGGALAAGGVADGAADAAGGVDEAAGAVVGGTAADGAGCACAWSAGAAAWGVEQLAREEKTTSDRSAKRMMAG
jgi:hypothetical protein